MKLIEPYVERMESRRERMGEVSQRVGTAAPGTALGEDLIFLDECAQDFQRVARLLEGGRSALWQGLAAAVGTRSDALEGLLRPHLH